MTDKDIKDYCKNCDVEPPAMRFKCPECEHNPDNENNFEKDINIPCKEPIMINGVDVSKCEFYMHYDYGKFSHGCSLHKDMFGLPVCCDIADCCKDCYFKQLACKTAECEKYKQALINIEKLVSKWYENEVIQYQSDYDEFLAIINKAKGRMNG